MKLSKIGMCLALVLMASSVWSETAVIVNAANNSTMDASTISRIFLGKAKSFPNGTEAVPLDQSEGSALRKGFNETILGKSSSQLKAYWSRLIFTGKGTPPKESGTDADIIALVAANPNMIGYVDAASVTDAVKVVHRF